MMKLIAIIFFLVSCNLIEASEAGMEFFGLKEATEKKEQPSADAIKEIKNLIKTIENKAKRDQLIKALKALTVVSKAKGSQENILLTSTKIMAKKVEEIAALALRAFTAVVNFPQEIMAGVTRLLADEVAPRTLLNFLFKLFLVFGVSILFEISMFSYLRRFYSPPPAFPARLLWGVAPLCVFTLLTSLLISFLTIPPLTESLLTLMFAILATRFVWLASLLILSPRKEENRFIPLSDKSAARLHSWLLTLGQLLILGIITTQIGEYLLLSPTGLETWTRFYGFMVTLVMIGFINTYKESISRWLHPETKNIDGSSRLIVWVLSVLSRTWSSLAIILLLGTYISWALQAFDYLIYLSQGSLLTIILVSATIAFSRYLQGYSQGWFRLQKHEKVRNPRGLWNNVSQALLAITPFVQVIIYLLCFISVSWVWGFDFLELINDDIIREKIMMGVSVFIILWTARILWITCDLIIDYHMKPLVLKGHTIEPSMAAMTLGPIIRTACHFVLAISGVILIAQQLKINVTPLMYTFGIIGLAFSFGAQGLAKDLINGILILIEGNLAVGEEVIIGAYTGVIEAITPRSVFLRHGTGYVQSIPFSEVTSIINKSRDFTVARISIPIDFMTPIKTAYQSLETTTEQLKMHPTFGKMIRSPLTILGVSENFEKGYTVIAKIRISPDPDGLFIHEFYRQWKEIAEAENILIANYRHQIDISSQPQKLQST